MEASADKNMDLLRKVVANVARALSNEKYVDALLEGRLIAIDEKDGRFYPGDVAADFCFNIYAEMADELIKHKKINKKFRNRIIHNMADIAPIAFDKIYKNFNKLFDHRSAAWGGPLIMVLFMAEPTRDPNLTLLMMCQLFESFYEWKPQTSKVLH